MYTLYVMHKIPCQLVKRLSDGACGEQKWQIEIPEQYRMQGCLLEGDKGKFFVIMGRFEDEAEINKILGKY